MNNEGFLYKYRNRLQGWEYRYFRLTKSYFQYYDAKHSPAPRKTIVRSDIISVSDKLASSQRKYPFEIVTKSDGTWFLDANTCEEKERWISVLKTHLPPHLAQTDLLSKSTQQEKEASPDIPISLPSYAMEHTKQSSEQPPSYEDCL